MSDLADLENMLSVIYHELIIEELGIDPTTLKYLTPRLKRAHYRAVINWIKLYKPGRDSSRTEQMKGFCEALDHLTQLDKSKNIDNFADLNIKNRTVQNTPVFTQLGKFILSDLNIDPAEVKALKRLQIRAHYRAIINWLTEYKLSIDASQKEKIQNFCEVYHHLVILDKLEKYDEPF